MDFVPLLEVVRPALITNVLLMASWIMCGKLTEVWNGSSQIKHMWCLIGLMAALVPFARNTHFAFFTTLSVIEYMPFMLSLVLYVNSMDRLRALLRVWVWLMIYLALKGIVFRGKGGSSFLSDENDFSLLMNMMIPFAYFLFLYVESGRERTFYLVATVLGVISVVASFSRGGFVGLVVVATIIWWFSPHKLITVVVLGLVGGMVAIVAGPKYWEEMGTITNTSESTASARIDSWKAAWEMFKDNPWGVGPANFPFNFHLYQEVTEFKRGMWGRAAHSLWFTLLSELGVAGVLVYLSLFRQNVRDLLVLKKVRLQEIKDERFVRIIASAFLASIGGFCASGTFLSVLYYPHFYYLTAMIVVAVKLVSQVEPKGSVVPSWRRQLQ